MRGSMMRSAVYNIFMANISTDTECKNLTCALMWPWSNVRREFTSIYLMKARGQIRSNLTGARGHIEGQWLRGQA